MDRPRKSRRQRILDAIDHLADNLAYYHDIYTIGDGSTFSREEFAYALVASEITVEEMGRHFAAAIERLIAPKPAG